MKTKILEILQRRAAPTSIKEVAQEIAPDSRPVLKDCQRLMPEMVKQGLLHREQDPEYKQSIRYLYTIAKAGQAPAPDATAPITRLNVSGFASITSAAWLLGISPDVFTLDKCPEAVLTGLAIRGYPLSSFLIKGVPFEAIVFLAEYYAQSGVEKAKALHLIASNMSNFGSWLENQLRYSPGPVPSHPNPVVKPAPAVAPTVPAVIPTVELAPEPIDSPSPAPVEPFHIPASIRDEFRVNEKGQAFISIRGAARVLGIDKRTLSAEYFPSKPLETLTKHGFQVGSFGTTGIPDIAFAIIAEYYAFDAGKWCKEQAKLVYRAFASIGIRTWIQQELDWQAPTNPQPAPSKPEPQPALNPETVELRSVVPHPQVIGGLVDASQFMITAVGLLNQKVEQLDALLQRQEQTRRLVEEDLLSVKPSVPAPPKTDRKALIGYIRKWCYLTQVAYRE